LGIEPVNGASPWASAIGASCHAAPRPGVTDDPHASTAGRAARYTAALVTRPRLSGAWRSYAHRLGQASIDLALLAAAYWLAYFFRFDASLPRRYERLFLATVLLVVGLKIAVFVAARFYTKWWRFTSIRDLQTIVLATVVSS